MMTNFINTFDVLIINKLNNLAKIFIIFSVQLNTARS